jgi:hypothetical protein
MKIFIASECVFGNSVCFTCQTELIRTNYKSCVISLHFGNDEVVETVNFYYQGACYCDCYLYHRIHFVCILFELGTFHY